MKGLEGVGGHSGIIARAFVASVLSCHGVLVLAPSTWPEVCVNTLPSCSGGLATFSFTLHYRLWVYFGNAARRWEDIRLGGVTRQRKGECCFFFPLSLSLARSLSPSLPAPPPSLQQCFYVVMGSSCRGSRRSRLRQSQQSSALVRNAAVLYCVFPFFFCFPFLPHSSPPPTFCQPCLDLAAASGTNI